jgi:hypothetical protein
MTRYLINVPFPVKPALLVLGLLLSDFLWLQPAFAGEILQPALLRFSFNNDIFFRKDNKISAGWALQMQSQARDDWQEIPLVPDFMTSWAASRTLLSAPSLYKRAGFSLGQIIQTPDDISRKSFNPDDVPYAGVLALQMSVYAYDDRVFHGAELLVGLVGPAALGEQTQNLVHRVLNNEIAQGWNNQLSTELLLNINIMHKLKILRWHDATDKGGDLALNVNAGIGNLFTQLSLSIEMRFGSNMPGGFVNAADPVGFSVNHKARIKPGNPARNSLYGSLVLRSTYLQRDLFLDGNSFRNSASVDKQSLVSQLVVGVHYESSDWGLHFTLLKSSDDIDTSQLRSAHGNEAIGTIEFEWLY